jgi:hypothetical protein
MRAASKANVKLFPESMRTIGAVAPEATAQILIT